LSGGGGVEAEPHLARHGRQPLNLLPQIGVVVEQVLLPLEHRLEALFELALKDLRDLLKQRFEFGNLQPCFSQLALSGGQGQLQVLRVERRLWIVLIRLRLLDGRRIGACLVHR